MRQLESANLYGVFFKPLDLLRNLLDARPRALSDCIASLPRSVKGIAVENLRFGETAQQELFYKVPGLERLYLRKIDINEMTVSHLPELRNLRVLELDKVPHAAFLDKVALSGNNSRLLKLGLEQSSVTTADLKKIARLKSLIFLSFTDCFWTGSSADALRAIASLPSLTGLALSAESVSHNAAREIIKFKNLKKLYIHNYYCLSPAVHDEIQRALPACKIIDSAEMNVGFNPFQPDWYSY